MILPALIVVVAMAVATVYLHLRRQPDWRSLWRATLQLGVGVGLTRAAFASLGWYVVERTGGPLQVPAFALAMMAWPEAAILAERRTTPVSPDFYLRLSLLLVTSTVVFVGVVAVVAGLLHTSAQHRPQG